MFVRQLMTSDVKSCSPEDTLEAAARKLWDGDIGVLPVVSGARVVGMITDRDLCMAAYTQRRPLHELVVSGAMSKELHTVPPEASIEQALQLMTSAQVRRLAVVDDEGRPRGLLSMNDLAREATRPRSKLTAAAVVQAVGGISAPRAAAAPQAEEPRKVVALAASGAPSGSPSSPSPR